ncbi:hypothetical protein Pmani_029351 [Petrolisthes manimaculis]|uniref:Uncharacterized protein n=1 Tax=Petrolisthes manimaculis TaxID=1843537 RepID=A0AAE1NXR0_9EUCA|nr:hypothetical protein Pmani_029351 [Petrolisthes manimaculis]
MLGGGGTRPSRQTNDGVGRHIDPSPGLGTVLPATVPATLLSQGPPFTPTTPSTLPALADQDQWEAERGVVWAPAQPIACQGAGAASQSQSRETNKAGLNFPNC